MKSDELEQVLRRVIREEFIMLPTDANCLPPPVDADAEREVIAGILIGLARPKWFPRLKWEHFFHPGFSLVYQFAIEECNDTAIDTDGLTLRLIENELPGAKDWIDSIACSFPWRGRPLTEVSAMTVTEMYRRRKLIEIFDQAVAGLRAGTTTAGSVVAMLNERLGERREHGKRKG